ncbi:MAG: transcriptional regulatory protein [uncultured bacterium]|nr:MAG: transcriptional regulatory protein [uncultured bacterium]
MTDFSEILTKNEKMLSVIAVAKKISTSDISILINGESGVGKKMMASAIHTGSQRTKAPFVVVNCSAIPPSLMEAELFGSSKSSKGEIIRGKFELAQNGTIFLDEIHCLNAESQAKLFQTIETKQFAKADGDLLSDVNVRIIASTSEDLIGKVEQNEFRMDLYYRLREMILDIPSLQDRKEDIPLLIDSFIKQYTKDFGKKISGISDVALNFLVNHDWNENVLELRNVIRTAVALCEKNKIWLEDIPLKMELGKEDNTSSDIMTLESFALKDVEKNHILKTLNHCRWNKSKAAKLLKVSRPRLDRKILEYDLKKPDKKKKKIKNDSI